MSPSTASPLYQDVPIPVQRDYCLKLVDKHTDDWQIATQNGVPME